MKYKLARTEGVPCSSIYCMAHDARFDQNCSLTITADESYNGACEGDPYVSVCGEYVPEEGGEE